MTAFFILIAVGVALQSDTRQFTQSSYGAVPTAYGVLYDTLAELELPVSRSFARVDRLPATATIWWIEPPSLQPAEATVDTEQAAPDAADDASDAPEEAEPDDAKERAERRPLSGRAGLSPAARDLAGPALGEWIAAGGTALVFLGPQPNTLAVQRLGDLVVPARERFLPSDAQAAAADAVPGAPRALASPVQIELRGPLLPAPRTVTLDRPLAFVERAEDWRTVVSAAGRPFALERSLGEGRLVVVADARFLSNRFLPRADAAPLALDFVRAYGVPRIDERAHGFSASRGAIATLAASPAAFFFVGLALAGSVFAWLGGSLPRRRVGDAVPPAPTLEGYVNAMADYYGATREYARVLARYRDLSARRLRRALALPADATLARVVERAARSRRADPEALALLADGAPVRDPRGLSQAARKLDEMVKGIAS